MLGLKSGNRVLIWDRLREMKGKMTRLIPGVLILSATADITIAKRCDDAI